MLFCSRTATRLVAALLFMATAVAAANFTITVFQPASYTLTPTAADQMAALSSAIQQASAAGSDLLVCPELYHSGYNLNLRSLAEPRNGPSFMIVASLARKYNQGVQSQHSVDVCRIGCIAYHGVRLGCLVYSPGCTGH